MILRILRFTGAGLMLLALIALGFSVSSCASNGARLSALEGTAPPAPYRIERDLLDGRDEITDRGAMLPRRHRRNRGILVLTRSRRRHADAAEFSPVAEGRPRGHPFAPGEVGSQEAAGSQAGDDVLGGEDPELLLVTRDVDLHVTLIGGVTSLASLGLISAHGPEERPDRQRHESRRHATGAEARHRQGQQGLPGGVPMGRA